MKWIWLELDIILEIQRYEVSVSGGSHGIRDIGLLESAIERPKNMAYYKPDAPVGALAATLAYGIVKNHPFIDGNKRAGFITAITFAEENGWEFNCPNEEIVRTIESLAASQLSEEDLTVWFESHLTPMS
ncbi:MAG: type II toxin-antitoxin system death-on-curing family toxin [Candidatus Sumerlaeia bacterium]|nr:type II toxin-antitoxin system death-on-curing family toxin [Candidatus Sumerlaeia bacterium]